MATARLPACCPSRAVLSAGPTTPKGIPLRRPLKCCCTRQRTCSWRWAPRGCGSPDSPPAPAQPWPVQRSVRVGPCTLPPTGARLGSTFRMAQSLRPPAMHPCQDVLSKRKAKTVSPAGTAPRRCAHPTCVCSMATNDGLMSASSQSTCLTSAGARDTWSRVCVKPYTRQVGRRQLCALASKPFAGLQHRNQQLRERLPEVHPRRRLLALQLRHVHALRRLGRRPPQRGRGRAGLLHCSRCPHYPLVARLL